LLTFLPLHLVVFNAFSSVFKVQYVTEINMAVELFVDYPSISFILWQFWESIYIARITYVISDKMVNE